MTAEEIAAVCHEANRMYCQILGDTSQPRWENAPVWQRESAVLGVEAAIKNPGSSPEENHQNWLWHKMSTGWTYGAVKDPEARKHPCLVPYDQLPLEQRRKDALFVAIVRSLKPGEEP